jgi:hypothetical protein
VFHDDVCVVEGAGGGLAEQEAAVHGEIGARTELKVAQTGPTCLYEEGERGRGGGVGVEGCRGGRT